MGAIKRITTPYSYSSAVAAGEYIFLGLHRGFGAGFPEQLTSVFEGLKKTLAQFDLGLERLLKVHVWLKNINDLPEMERLFNDYFEKDNFPGAHDRHDAVHRPGLPAHDRGHCVPGQGVGRTAREIQPRMGTDGKPLKNADENG